MDDVRTLEAIRGVIVGVVADCGVTEGVVTAVGDNICWMDVFTRLAHLAGVEFRPALLPRDQMLAQCTRFVDSLHAGCPYAADDLTALAREACDAKGILAMAGLSGALPETVALLVRIWREHRDAQDALRAAGYGVSGTPLAASLAEALEGYRAHSPNPFHGPA